MVGGVDWGLERQGFRTGGWNGGCVKGFKTIIGEGLRVGDSEFT